MKTVITSDHILKSLLIPLWIGVITGILNQLPKLYYPTVALITLILLFMYIQAFLKWLKKIDASYKCKRRKMDTIVLKARNKLKKIVARTESTSVINHALEKLQEICPPKTYLKTLASMIEKEKRPVIKEILHIRLKQAGGEL